MGKAWSNSERRFLKELYEESGYSLSEIYPIFNKKYNRTLEGVKIKIKKDKLKHTKKQTKKIKSRLNKGELNSMFGKTSPLKGLTKENSNIIKEAAKKNSKTKIKMFKENLLPDVKGKNNPMYGLKPWNHGLTKHTDERIYNYGKKISKSKKEEWINKTDEEKDVIIKRLNDAMIQTKKPTRIEVKIENYIKTLNINYKKNYRIGMFLMDFYLTDYNIVIECDGDYWHSNPKFYNYDSLDKIQMKNHDRDKRKNELLIQIGVIFIRFWEYDIHNSFEDVKLQIKKIICNKYN